MSQLADLARLDATAQAALVAHGELSPAELLAAAQERIDALDPLLGAVVTRADPPPGPAGAAGPFAGVPFLVKDATPCTVSAGPFPATGTDALTALATPVARTAA